MGLDHLDIHFRLERRFKIKIRRDENVFLWSTPQRIADLVWAKLNGIDPAVPDLQQLMAKVYQSLFELPDRPTGFLRNFFPSQDLEGLIQETQRRENWRALGASLSVELPALIEQGTNTVPRIPPEIHDPLSLACWIVDHFPEQADWLRPERANSVAREEVEWSREQVWESVREIVSDALAVRVDRVTPGARMIEDLGMA